MKTLVIYDTAYGNTEKIALAITAALAPAGEARSARSTAVTPGELASVDLLIIGAPTQGGRPTKPVQELLARIPPHGLSKIRVAAFDTRIPAREKGIGVRILTGVIGYAAPRIADRLKEAGGQLAAPPEGFFVIDNEGPLKDGELDRAATWAKSLAG